jgi:hypothetical protein
MSTKLIRCFFWLVFALMTVTSVTARGAGGAPGTDNALASRFAFIEQLIERSSAAQQVEASANNEAKAKRQAARLVYRQAQDARNAGDNQLIFDLLNKAARNMFEAARMAGRNEILAEKRKQGFQARIKSVNALLAAHDRVSDPDAATENTDSFHASIQNKVSQAEQLSERGDLIAARDTLDTAYGALKVAIDELRGGRTLVHALHFATKVDEYEYETGRNRSHRMLVKVLLDDKMRGNPKAKQMVEGLMSQADKSRVIATRHAKKGDYTAAITAMEKSTAHIVRAIRGVGIYIPG